MRKILIIALACISLSTFAKDKKKCSKSKCCSSSTAIALTNKEDSAAYALGVQLASSLKRDGMEVLNPDIIVYALKKVYANDSLLLSDEQIGTVLNSYYMDVQKQKMDAQLAENAKFLADNKLNKDVITTASGLQYQVIKMGAGIKPTADSTVTVNYKGMHLDGSVFDSSYDYGEPVTFPLKGVIPGWTEGVQLMPQGSIFKFFIPSELAYGEMGTPQGGPIAPNEILIFEIELLSVGGAK